MHVEHLALYQFRLYGQRRFQFSPHVNIIEGPNAHGKTALLEALYLAAVGTSFRTNHLGELVRQGTSSFGLELVYHTSGLDQHIKIVATSKERHVYLNSERRGGMAALLGGVRAAVFTPDDSNLVKGGPQARRHYLDVQLAQVDPLYTHHLRRYNRALKQRNCLLKAESATAIDSWEYELALSAAYLIVSRATATEALKLRFERLYRHISGLDSSLGLHYRCSSSVYQQGMPPVQLHGLLCQRWQGTRARDIAAGTTLSGPHRDELLLSLDGFDLRHYGSEGEKRTAAAALRLAEWEQIASHSDDELPLLLIDDLAMGLDPHRQANFIAYLATAGQVFVTTAQPLKLSDSLRDIHHLLLQPCPS